MDFKKKEEAVKAAPIKAPPPPPALISVPVQGTIIPGPDGHPIGVICGYGWVAEGGGMRPVVQIAIRGGGIAVLPAELANTVESAKEEEEPRLVKPV